MHHLLPPLLSPSLCLPPSLPPSLPPYPLPLYMYYTCACTSLLPPPSTSLPPLIFSLYPPPFSPPSGDSDAVVSYKWGSLSSQFVSAFNSDNYLFRTYPGLGHSSCPEVHIYIAVHFHFLFQTPPLSSLSPYYNTCILSTFSLLLYIPPSLPIFPPSLPHSLKAFLPLLIPTSPLSLPPFLYLSLPPSLTHSLSLPFLPPLPGIKRCSTMAE